MRTRSKQMIGAVALAWALFVLCVVTQAFGTVTVLDAWREVGAEGRAGALSFSSVDSMSGAGEFNGEVNESRDTNPSWWLSNHVGAISEQNTVIDENGLSGSGRIDLQSWVPQAGPYGGTSGRAWNTLSFTFLALEAQEFTLSLSSGLVQMTEFEPRPVLDFSLIGVNSGSMFTQQPWERSGGTWSGLLLPDTYTFALGTRVVVAHDPLGDGAWWDYNVDLAVRNVPDTGSTLLLLGIGVVGLFAVKRRMAVA